MSATRASLYINRIIGVSLALPYAIERVRGPRGRAARFRLVQTMADELLPDRGPDGETRLLVKARRVKLCQPKMAYGFFART